MKFKELSKKNINEVEKDILNYWNNIDILNKTIDNRKDNEDFVFYDGPATANPIPLKRYIV